MAIPHPLIYDLPRSTRRGPRFLREQEFRSKRWLTISKPVTRWTNSWRIFQASPGSTPLPCWNLQSLPCLRKRFPRNFSMTEFACARSWMAVFQVA